MQTLYFAYAVYGFTFAFISLSVQFQMVNTFVFNVTMYFNYALHITLFYNINCLVVIIFCVVYVPVLVRWLTDPACAESVYGCGIWTCLGVVRARAK